MIKRMSLLIACLIGSFGPTSAHDGPKSSFEATYASAGPAGASTVRMISDGKGHMRTETSTNGNKFVSIMDYPAKQAITLIEAQKMAMRVPLKPAQDVHDAQSAKKSKARPLGSKVVNGHPCHGWEYSVQTGGKVEVWTGDDINYLVKSETTVPQGKMTMDLKSWKPATPGADQFKVPAGYKMMQVPGT